MYGTKIDLSEDAEESAGGGGGTAESKTIGRANGSSKGRGRTAEENGDDETTGGPGEVQEELNACIDGATRALAAELKAIIFQTLKRARATKRERLTARR